MTQCAYPVTLWRWRLASETPPGKRITTRHHLSEADALARDPNAERVPGSERVIEGPVGAHGTPWSGKTE